MKNIIMKLSAIIIILIGITLAFAYSGNSMTWDWAKNIAGTNKNYSYALVTDKDGNNYVAGSFSDTLKIENTIMISKGSYDIYLLKFDPEGNLIWAKQAGGTDMDEAYGLAEDHQGHLYMTGYTSDGWKDADRVFFLAKYNSKGEQVWIRQGGGATEDYGTAVAADNKGNVFITGVFKGCMNIGNQKLVSKGDKDIFIIKYNNNGEVLWSAGGGGNMADISTAIAADQNGNCYVTGDFEGTAELGKKIIESAGKNDVFLAKFSSDGTIQWLKRAGSATGDDHASAISLDDSDNVFLAGYFSGLAKFGSTNLKNMGSEDIFLAKYSTSGNEIWARQTGGKGNERARAMKLDKGGNVYVAGEFNVDFTFGRNNIKNLGDWDIFILKYSSNGSMIGGTQIGGVGYDKAYGIGLDNNANIFVTGYFSKEISIGNTDLNSADADDSFIAKLESF